MSPDQEHGQDPNGSSSPATSSGHAASYSRERKARGRSQTRWARSIRFRLTAWFVAIFAALLLAGGIVFVSIIQRGMLADADFYLARQSRRISKLVYLAGTPPALSNAQLEQLQVTVLTSRFPGLLWFDTVYSRVLDDRTRRVIAESPSIETQTPLARKLDNELRIIRAGNGPQFDSTSVPNGRRIRVCVSRSDIQGHVYLLEVAVPWDSQEYRLSGMEGVLAISILGVLALGAVGGWFLVRGTLRPIDRIVTEADRVNADSLGSALLPAPKETDSEIGRLVDTLNRMADRLHEAFTSQQRYADAQKRFAADASHELRTPLTALRVEIEYALLEHRRASEYRNALEGALTDIDRLGRIVESLMILARLDIGHIGQASNGGAVDIDSLIDVTVRDLAGMARDNGVTLNHVRRLPPIERANADRDNTKMQAPTVVGEDQHIRLIVRNLVDNAIKYTPVGGSVDVSARVETIDGATWVIIDVADDGIGIAEEELPHVFDRFWRSDQARSILARQAESGDAVDDRSAPNSISGVGLGLSIAHQVAVLLGGDITVTSTLGKGSTFTMRLPMAA